jgi:hypothetical protein
MLSPVCRACPHLALVPLASYSGSPEFGHEFGTKSAEGAVACSGSGTVITASGGRGAFDKTSMIVRAMPPARSRTTLVTAVIGERDTAISPNTTSHTGMIAERLNTLNILGLSKEAASLRRRGDGKRSLLEHAGKFIQRSIENGRESIVDRLRIHERREDGGMVGLEKRVELALIGTYVGHGQPVQMSQNMPPFMPPADVASC